MNTRQNRSILGQHLDEIAQNAEDSTNSNPEENTLHGNLESAYDCKMGYLDSEFLLAYNLSLASRNKGKRAFSGYQFTRKQIVVQWLQTAEDASKDASPKDIENLIKDRMPNSVWEIFHSQRQDKSLHLIRDMSKDSRHSALCDAYDEYIQEVSDCRLSARREALCIRALKKQRRQPFSSAISDSGCHSASVFDQSSEQALLLCSARSQQ